MKIILKVLALPLLFIVTVACTIGNLITNISSHVIALLLLVIAGCSIYCIVKALWTSLAILAGMGLAAILIIFLLVWAVVKLETLGNHIKEFICYFRCVSTYLFGRFLNLYPIITLYHYLLPVLRIFCDDN